MHALLTVVLMFLLALQLACGDDGNGAPGDVDGTGGDGEGASAGGDGDSTVVGDGDQPAVGDGDGDSGTAGDGDGAVGDGDGDGGGPDGTDLAYTGAFTMGTTIATKHKCLDSVIGNGMGDNISPALEWRGGPVDTLSFAVVLFDTRYNYFHWALWDIPASATGLPEGLGSGYDVPEVAGAHQISGNGGPGYFGPCSDAGSSQGTYEYRLHALDAATLALTDSSTSTEVQAAIVAASLDTVVWSGTPQ